GPAEPGTSRWHSPCEMSAPARSRTFIGSTALAVTRFSSPPSASRWGKHLIENRLNKCPNSKGGGKHEAETTTSTDETGASPGLAWPGRMLVHRRGCSARAGRLHAACGGKQR